MQNPLICYHIEMSRTKISHCLKTMGNKTLWYQSLVRERTKPAIKKNNIQEWKETEEDTSRKGTVELYRRLVVFKRTRTRRHRRNIISLSLLYSGGVGGWKNVTIVLYERVWIVYQNISLYSYVEYMYSVWWFFDCSAVETIGALRTMGRFTASCPNPTYYFFIFRKYPHVGIQI